MQYPSFITIQFLVENGIDSAYKDMGFIFKAVLYEAYFEQPNATKGLVRYNDIENLNSNFLITYIDSTFNAIQKRPWLNTLTFEQLCEYILPYRVGNERPRQFYRLQDSLLKSEINEIINCDDIYDVNKIFSRYHSLFLDIEKEIKIRYRGQYIHYNILSCMSRAIEKKWRAKLLLFPLATDLTPAYPNQNGRHCWSAIIDNTRTNSTYISSKQNMQGKIYRNTFSHNPYPESQDKEFIPSFFRTPFLQDITSYYTPTRTIEIKPRISIPTTYGYLCVFNDLEWKPIAYTNYEKGIFKFKDTGTGIVYLPVIYPDEQAVPVSYPFILNLQGKLHSLEPDTNHLTTVKLERKYLLKQSIKLANKRFIHSLLEASNDSLFKQKDRIGMFKNLSDLQWSEIKINNRQKYRYWRIRSAEHFVIAECLLYNQEGQSVKPNLNNQNKSQLYYSAFDNNPITYVYSDEDTTLQWDMGEKISLSSIECLLRNDGNNIWPGHWYELCYHDGTEWYSLGVKEAVDKFIEFSNVPGNALLWLRNLTTGREERVFTFTNEKAHFW